MAGRSHSERWRWALAVCSVALGCAEAPTQIVVVVDPDPSVQSRLTSVLVTTRRSGEARAIDAGLYAIPQHLLQTTPTDGHLILRPGDPADARGILVTVTGNLREGTQVSYAIATHFERGKTLYLHALLTNACVRTAPCPEGQTCREGACEGIPEQRLSETPPTLIDAALDDRGKADLVLPDGADVPGDGGADVDVTLPDVSDVTDAPADVTDADGDAAADIGDAANDADASEPADVVPDVTFTDAADAADATLADAFEGGVGPDAADASDVSSDSAVVDDASSMDAPVDRGADAEDAVADVSTDRMVADVDPTSVPPPTLVAPLSTAIVTQRAPRFQWRAGAGIDEVELQVCRDRACTMVQDRVLQGLTAPIREDVRETLPSADLPARNLFWRMRGRRFGVPGTTWSEVRQVRVPARSATHYAVGPTENDLNGDGFSDIIATAGSTQILWGTPSGLTSTAAQSLPTGGSVAVPGDINQDGIVDLVAGRIVDQFPVWWGASGASGVSTTPARITPPLTTERLLDPSRAGDVNADGFADVAVGNFQMNHLLVFLGDVRGGLTYNTTLAVTGVTNLAAPPDTAGDVDGDSYSDLLTAPQVGNMCRVYFGGTDGLRSAPFVDFAENVPTGWQLSGETNPVGDVDGDGYFDVSCGAQVIASSQRTQCIYFGGPLRSTARRQCLDLFSSGSNSSGSYSDGADFDLDGFSDVVIAVANATRVTLGIYAGAAGSLAATPRITIQVTGSGEQWAFVRAQDFNGDGLPDLFLTTARDGSFYFQNTAGSFSLTPTRTFPGLIGYYFAQAHPWRSGSETMVTRGMPRGASGRQLHARPSRSEASRSARSLAR